MVHRRADGIDESLPLLIVDDSFAALWRLGTAARARSAARFIAVTGSVGTTGTKEALRLCLSPQGVRSEAHTSELQSLMRISYAVSCLTNTKTTPCSIQP